MDLDIYKITKEVGFSDIPGGSIAVSEILKYTLTGEFSRIKSSESARTEIKLGIIHGHLDLRAHGYMVEDVLNNAVDQLAQRVINHPDVRDYLEFRARHEVDTDSARE